MTDDELVGVLEVAAETVAAALDATEDWSLTGEVAGEHRSDLAADAAAVSALSAAGLGVVSEESGRHHPDREITVVVDPLDGSTNAARGISRWATSLCAVDGDGPRAALVVDLVVGTRYQAVRGGGARVDGHPVTASRVATASQAIVALNGLPDRHLGWSQYRCLGAAAIDLCLVASGGLDGFVDCSGDGLAPWDYLGGMLVCEEAGATVTDLWGRPLADTERLERRSVVAGATGDLAAEFRDARAVANPVP